MSAADLAKLLSELLNNSMSNGFEFDFKRVNEKTGDKLSLTSKDGTVFILTIEGLE